jgi:hypothetical protein
MTETDSALNLEFNSLQFILYQFSSLKNYKAKRLNKPVIPSEAGMQTLFL